MTGVVVVDENRRGTVFAAVRNILRLAVEPEMRGINLALFVFPSLLEIAVRDEFAVDLDIVNQDSAAGVRGLCPLSHHIDVDVAAL